MKKQTLLKIVNPILILVAFLQLVNTIILKYIARPDWLFSAHEMNGMVLLGLIVVHFALNLDWIKNVLFKKKAS